MGCFRGHTWAQWGLRMSKHIALNPINVLKLFVSNKVLCVDFTLKHKGGPCIANSPLANASVSHL